MRVEPRKSVFHGRCARPGGNGGAAYHHDREVQHTGRFDLGDCCAPAGILGDDHVDAMLAKKPGIARRSEWTLCLDQGESRQIGKAGGTVDQADDVAMLRRGLEVPEKQASDGREDDAGRRSKSSDRTGHIGHLHPEIVFPSHPRGPFHRNKGNARLSGRSDGIAAHPCRKRMGGIDQEVDIFVAQEVREALRPAETAGANRNRLRARRGRAAGEREQRLESSVCREGFGEPARFARSSKDEETHGSRL